MNETLKLMDLLVHRSDDVEAVMDAREGIDCERIRATLQQLTRGSRPQDVLEATAYRNVVRLIRGC